METVNQEEKKTNVEETEQKKTFTQEELDAILADRLSRERNKYSDYEAIKEKARKFDEAEDANKTELERANEKANQLETELNALKESQRILSIKNKVSTETGVPINLLSGTDEEACRLQAKSILDFAKKSDNGYPIVKDGGETRKSGITKEEILKIKDSKERLKAIEDNIELFN